MTALPVQSSAPRSSPRPSPRPVLPPTPSPRDGVIRDPYFPDLSWVPIDLAAKALSITERALRMKGEALKRAGFAKQFSPVIGGQLKWHFSTRYDPRLAALLRDDRPASDQGAESADALKRFLAMPKSKQDSALARVVAVKLFRQWRSNPTTTVTNPEHQRSLITLIKARCGLEPRSIQRLYDWHALVQSIDLSSPGGTQIAALELVDRRGGNRENGYSGEAWDVFKAEYLRDNKLSVRHCWQVAGAQARAKGWTWIGLRHATRLVQELLPASVRTLAREGNEAWQRAHLPSVEQDPEAWAAGQCWETDHTRCDFFCRTVRGGQVVADRPWITAFLDRRSRRLMGWSMNWSADSDSIRAALHDALSQQDVSVPEVVILDNGKDFASQEFSGVTKQERRRGEDPSWSGLFSMLGITPHFATPYNHNGKARIERFFGVVHQGFDRALDSWSGSGGVSGGGARDPEAVKALLDEPIRLPTLEEVREKFRAWAEHYNHNADRNIEALVDEGGVRRSPAEWYASRLPKFRTLPNKRRVLSMLEHRWTRPVTPHKNGVSIKISGRTLSYGQHEPALVDLVGSGRKVHVTYSPVDTGSVRVYDERFALLCEAPLNTRHGGVSDAAVSRADLQAAIARQRQHKRDAKRQVDIAAAVLPIADLALLEQREREVAETRARLKAEGHDAPPAMRLVSSPLSGEGGDEDNASRVPLRKAAGAEADEFPHRTDAFVPLRLADDDFAVLPDAEEPDADDAIDPDDLVVSDAPWPDADADAAWLEEGLR